MEHIIRAMINGPKFHIDFDFSNVDGKQYTIDDVLKILCSLNQHDRKQINMLLLDCKNITWKEMIHFSNTKWTNLTHLNIGWNLIGGKGCKYLSRAQMPNLQSLLLGGNKFGSEGLSHLTKAPWINLKQLQIYDNALTDKSIQRLVHSSWIKLEQINISWNYCYLDEFEYLLLWEKNRINLILLNCNPNTNGQMRKLMVKFNQMNHQARAQF